MMANGTTQWRTNQPWRLGLGIAILFMVRGRSNGRLTRVSCFLIKTIQPVQERSLFFRASERFEAPVGPLHVFQVDEKIVDGVGDS